MHKNIYTNTHGKQNGDSAKSISPSCMDCRTAGVRCVPVRSRRLPSAPRPGAAYTVVAAARWWRRDERTTASCEWRPSAASGSTRTPTWWPTSRRECTWTAGTCRSAASRSTCREPAPSAAAETGYKTTNSWWWRGVVMVTSLVSINQVNLRWARLVLGWVTCPGSTPGGGTLFRYVID